MKETTSRNMAEKKEYCSYLRYVENGRTFIPTIAEKLVGTERVVNAENTANRHPKGWSVSNPISWIYYWQAVTGIHSNELRCACCGKHIFVDCEIDTCKIAYLGQYKYDQSITKESFKALGGHIKRFYPEGANSEDCMTEYCIVPLCSECNAKHGEEIVISDTVICAEIDPVVE